MGKVEGHSGYIRKLKSRTAWGITPLGDHPPGKSPPWGIIPLVNPTPWGIIPLGNHPEENEKTSNRGR